jgi:crotonobetainyl-CoA:carnitine CoA-transferase CaiB-like acyl-CoA transferase
MTQEAGALPLSGVRVVELGHFVLGPTCGLVLADLGAEVIKIERAPEGDETRRLQGMGVGFFHYFNRNKLSLTLDLKGEEGKGILRRLIAASDVLCENFGPGAMARLGFGYEACAKLNPRLIYCALKGFMPGPYENRLSLDHLVQMMGGLAYMTGPQGRPLRAGASVIDIMGGVYGALGIITALYERTRTGRGQLVRATLFEAVAFLMGQHMAMIAFTGEPAPPMPEGVMPWGVYDLFATRDGEMIFIGITGDQQWERFCQGFGLDDLLADERLNSNNKRIQERAWFIPRIQEAVAREPMERVVALCDASSVPYAPIARPDQLFEDPQLNQGGGLVETVLPDGRKTKLPKQPLRLGDRDLGLRREPPRMGEGSRGILQSIGFTGEEIQGFLDRRVVAVDSRVSG